jgi:hypothetical protein
VGLVVHREREECPPLAGREGFVQDSVSFRRYPRPERSKPLP